MLLKSGGDYGWPECYYDGLQKKLVLAPEYGGNRDLVGWSVNHWPGDTQPRGFTPEQVSNPDAQPVTPALSAKAAAAALKFLPALAGEAAARHAPWRARPGFERG